MPGHGPAWPVRSGAIPPFADGFTPRLETVPDVDAALVPGVTVALVPAGPRDWLASAGKTQVAVSCAETLWQARTIDLLIWVNASSRASALSGFLRGAAAVGANPHADADAESTVAQLISWLATTTRPWLVVLDDVCAAADLEGLWPDGPAGRLIVTTSDIGTIPRDRHAVALRVPLYSAREATAFIAGRLTTNPDQRNGTIDLVYDLGSEPMALGHACAVIASSGLSCRDYREYYTEWKAGLAPAGGPAVAVTWALSAAYAEKLMPGSREVLTVSAFLDGHAIPGSVFTTLAVSKFLARESAFQSPDPEHTWNCVRALNQTGLLSIDATSTLPTVRVAQPVQEAVRAQLSAELSEHALRTVADTRGLRAGARARECRYHHGRHQAGRRTAGGGPGRGGGHLVPVGIRGADHLDTLAARDEYAAACVAAGNLAMAVDTYRLSLAPCTRPRDRSWACRRPSSRARSSASTVVIGVFGYRWIHRAMQVTIVITGISIVVMLIQALSYGSLAGKETSMSTPSAGLFLAGVALLVIDLLSWGPFVSDYTRYLPADTSGKRLFWAIYGGNVVSTILACTVGAYLTALLPDASSPVAAIAKVSGKWALVVMALSLITSDTLNAYTVTFQVLSFANMFKRFKSESVAIRVVPFVLVMAIGVVIGLIGYGHFVSNLSNFLDVLLVIFIPWSAVNLTDYVYGKIAWRGLLAYAIGLGAEWPFVSLPDYVGPLVAHLGGAGISYFVGFFVAAIVYVALVSLFPAPADHRQGKMAATV